MKSPSDALQPFVAKTPTKLEATTGSPITEAALTLATSAAAISFAGPATLLLPAIPFLVKTAAAGRQERRMHANFQEIERVLLQHEAALVQLSDEQYALMNEVVLAAMGSTNDTKLEYLRNAVLNVLSLSELRPQEAVVLGRVVRDMSADEARFLVTHHHPERLISVSRDASQSPDHHVIDPDSDEALCVFGLLSLGVLTPGDGMFETMGLLGYSRLAPKLVELISVPTHAAKG